LLFLPINNPNLFSTQAQMAAVCRAAVQPMYAEMVALHAF